jgi:hypothetical protein
MVGLEAGLVAAAMVLMLLWGLGARHRHKKILQDIALERTKLENDTESFSLELSSNQSKALALAEQISTLEGQCRALQQEKQELDAYLSAKDNQRSIRASRAELTKLEERLSIARKLVDGYTIATVATNKGDPCHPAYKVLLSEAGRIWSVAPGLKLIIKASNNYIEWSGSSMESLGSCVELVKSRHTFNGNSHSMSLMVSS